MHEHPPLVRRQLVPPGFICDRPFESSSSVDSWYHTSDLIAAWQPWWETVPQANAESSVTVALATTSGVWSTCLMIRMLSEVTPPAEPERSDIWPSSLHAPRGCFTLFKRWPWGDWRQLVRRKCHCDGRGLHLFFFFFFFYRRLHELTLWNLWLYQYISTDISSFMINSRLDLSSVSWCYWME